MDEKCLFLDVYNAEEMSICCGKSLGNIWELVEMSENIIHVQFSANF